MFWVSGIFLKEKLIGYCFEDLTSLKKETIFQKWPHVQCCFVNVTALTIDSGGCDIVPFLNMALKWPGS